jgi:hypothetical protein
MSALVALAAVAAMFFVAAPSAALAFESDSSGDMVVFGGQHEVIKEGQEVNGDLMVLGGSADVFGKVDGDAVAIGGKIYIAPQGRVDGSLIELGGVIDNESNTPQRHGVPPPPTPEVTVPVIPEGQVPWYQQGWTVFFFIDALLAFMAFLLFPARTRSASEHLLDNPVLAGMLGFFSPVIFVLVIIALAITLVGIPLMPLAVLAVSGGYLIGKAAIAEFIGTRLFDVFKAAQPKPIASVALGLALLWFVSAATGWIGIVFYFCVAAFAIGTALYMLMRTAQNYRRTPIVTPTPPTFTPPVDPTRAGPPAVP